jgi:DNA-binding response OmpR family regulator
MAWGLHSINVARVLALDNDLATLNTLESILTEAGHSLLRATNASRALQILLSSDTIDLIVTDLVLPGLSRLALIKRLRIVVPAVPIVVVSGHVPPESSATRAELARLGVHRIVAKPFTRRELLAAISSSLR